MATRFSAFIAVLTALALAGCGGMGQRYAQNYATYTTTMSSCTSAHSTITVPGRDGEAPITIQQPNPACQGIQAPDHELRYVGPIISNGISTGVNAAVSVYQTERTTRSNEHIAEINAEARTEESRFENQTLQKAFEVAGPRVEGTGNAVGDGASATPPAEEPEDPPEEMEEPEDPEPPEELVEDL